MSVGICQYNTICSRLKMSPCDPQKFDVVKEQFRSEIKSERLFDKIRKIDELLVVLQKRDSLNSENIQPLKEIAIIIEDFETVELIHNILEPPSPTVQPNVSPPQRRNSSRSHETNSINNINLSGTVLPQIPTNVKDRIYLKIRSEIGCKWREFARALGVREGDIDRLDQRYKNIPDMVQEILLYHEKESERVRWQSHLLEALQRARRNDLRREVQNIIDGHSR